MSSAAKAAPTTKFEITVTHNGLNEVIEVNANQAVEAVFRHALKAFDVQGAGEGLALYDSSNRELDTNASVRDAGIAPGATLVLRQRVVRGG
jgi:hypothetical protein